MSLNIWTIVVVIILLIWIAKNMIKRDQFSSESFEEETTVQKDFEQLAPVYKINYLTNKLFELQKMNLRPSAIKVTSLRNRLEKLEEIKDKLVLQNYDEQLKCKEALMWLERPEKNRRCDPPSIIKACDPISDHDVEMAIELTKLPIDLSQDTLAVDQKPQRSMGTETDEEGETSASIPLVDEWIEKAFASLPHYLDSILDVLFTIYDRVINSVTVIIDKTKNNIHHLRRVLFISAQVEGDMTKISIDFMLPHDGVQLNNKVPVIVAAEPQQKIKKRCCTPIRYVPPALNN